MAAGLPILKLAGLLIKTVSKPISTRIKAEVSKFPNAAKVCIWVGEQSHQITSRINVFANGYRFLGAKPLPEDQALKDGVDVISETVLFLIAGGILVVEYNKSEQKNALKAAAALKKEVDDKKQLEQRFLELELEMAELRASLLATRKKPFEAPFGLRSIASNEDEANTIADNAGNTSLNLQSTAIVGGPPVPIAGTEVVKVGPN